MRIDWIGHSHLPMLPAATHLRHTFIYPNRKKALYDPNSCASPRQKMKFTQSDHWCFLVDMPTQDYLWISDLRFDPLAFLEPGEY